MNEIKLTKYTIIRIVLVVLLLALWIPAFLPSGIYSSQSMDTVASALTSSLSEDIYPKQGTQAIKRYLKIDPNDFDSIAFYRNDDAMSASEMLIASSSDQALLDSLQKAVEARINSQASVYEGYAPEQKALMDEALVDVQGNYVLYYVGDEPAKMDAAYIKALKGN